MWTKVATPHERDALLKDYLSCKVRVKQRFDAEKLSDISLQADAAKLFHPITAETERQAATQAKEIRKITHAIQHLPPDIAEEANFAKVLAEQQKAIQDAPPPGT